MIVELIWIREVVAVLAVLRRWWVWRRKDHIEKLRILYIDGHAHLDDSEVVQEPIVIKELLKVAERHLPRTMHRSWSDGSNLG